MRYMKVAWLHDDPDEPIMIFCECDDNGWETRKIEIYRGGRVTRAHKDGASEGLMLSVEPIPSLAEINLQSQFRAVEISEIEFNYAWQSSDGTSLLD